LSDADYKRLSDLLKRAQKARRSMILDTLLRLRTPKDADAANARAGRQLTISELAPLAARGWPAQ
jgi:hypothetical protein